MGRKYSNLPTNSTVLDKFKRVVNMRKYEVENETHYNLRTINDAQGPRYE